MFHALALPQSSHLTSSTSNRVCYFGAPEPALTGHAPPGRSGRGGRARLQCRVSRASPFSPGPPAPTPTPVLRAVQLVTLSFPLTASPFSSAAAACLSAMRCTGSTRRPARELGKWPTSRVSSIFCRLGTPPLRRPARSDASRLHAPAKRGARIRTSTRSGAEHNTARHGKM